MSFSKCLFVFAGLLSLSGVAHADYVAHPYNCKSISSKEGYQHIVEYRRGCSLRVAPEAIWKCKSDVTNGESKYFDSYELNFEKGCYNKNGYTRVTTCLYNNTWETTGASAYWTYQSAKALTCYYK